LSGTSFGTGIDAASEASSPNPKRRDEAPLFRRRRHQHGTRGGTRLAQQVVLISDGAAAAGVVAAVAVVLPARHVRQREFHLHAVPVRGQLLAQDLRQGSGHALPHLVLDHLEQHIPGGGDAQEVSHGSDAGGLRHAGFGAHATQAQGEATRGNCITQELASFHAPEACLMARRMRT
jgi:hypothetical protein